MREHVTFRDIGLDRLGWYIYENAYLLMKCDLIAIICTTHVAHIINYVVYFFRAKKRGKCFRVLQSASGCSRVLAYLKFRTFKERRFEFAVFLNRKINIF